MTSIPSNCGCTGSPYPQDGIHLSRIYMSHQRADTNKDGVLDRTEINREILRAHQYGETDLVQFWGTVVQGGPDGNGFFPDFLGSKGRFDQLDGKISLGDLAKLAFADIDVMNGTGSGEYISRNDFIATFGKQADVETVVDMDRVRKDAGSSGGGGYPPGNSNMLMDLLKQLLPFLLGGGGGYNPGYGGGGYNPGYGGGGYMPQPQQPYFPSYPPQMPGYGGGFNPGYGGGFNPGFGGGYMPQQPFPGYPPPQQYWPY